jgi:hypothetical protein
MLIQSVLGLVLPLFLLGNAANVALKTPSTGFAARIAAVRSHNGVIVVTEPVVIAQLALTGADTPLPSPPTGDLRREVRQITIRGRDVAWEWGLLSVSSDFFWMDADEVLVFPIRDGVQLADFRIRRAADSVGTTDIRIIYEA